jgi:tRNA-dihydrouridine synthase
LIGKIKENARITIPVFGNGDVDSPEKAKQMRDQYGVDGIMIGRASIGYPWIFNEIKHYLRTGEHLPAPSIDQRVDTCLKHFDFSIKWKGDKVGNVEMRRHYANYFRGFRDFKQFRMQLVSLNDNHQIRQVLEDARQFYTELEETAL